VIRRNDVEGEPGAGDDQAYLELLRLAVDAQRVQVLDDLRGIDNAQAGHDAGEPLEVAAPEIGVRQGQVLAKEAQRPRSPSRMTR
jgi:hypothetical protein